MLTRMRMGMMMMIIMIFVIIIIIVISVSTMTTYDFCYVLGRWNDASAQALCNCMPSSSLSPNNPPANIQRSKRRPRSRRCNRPSCCSHLDILKARSVCLASLRDNHSSTWDLPCQKKTSFSLLVGG